MQMVQLLFNHKIKPFPTSGERHYHCKERGSSFSRAGHMKRHLLTRSGEKPPKCTQCDYACSRVDALSYHIKTHFLQKPNQSQNQNFLITQIGENECNVLYYIDINILLYYVFSKTDENFWRRTEIGNFCLPNF